jgi:hypothetical protein
MHLALVGFEKNPVRADSSGSTRCLACPRIRSSGSAPQRFLRRQGKEDLVQEVTGRGKQWFVQSRTSLLGQQKGRALGPTQSAHRPFLKFAPEPLCRGPFDPAGPLPPQAELFKFAPEPCRFAIHALSLRYAPVTALPGPRKLASPALESRANVSGEASPEP